MPFTSADIAVAIPTFRRDEPLIDTIVACLREADPPGEVIVVDQTPEHTPAVAARLERFATVGSIRWERRRQPSQPAALNHALRIATKRLVLFLDDDIAPSKGFIAAHAAAHERHLDAWAVAGQILQPGEVPETTSERTRGGSLRADLEFPFRSSEQAWVANVMSGNMSVKRERALAVGGFDENFTGAVAYRFDTEFGRRLMAAGGKLLFEPSASIRHLRAPRGGTRSTGSHLTSASPMHGMGDYYFAMRSGTRMEALAYILRRPIREVSTRFHLRHPWFIPVKLLGEVRAVHQAFRAVVAGPRLISASDRSTTPDVKTDASDNSTCRSASAS